MTSQMMQSENKGAVLVVGAGIAGMEAALLLAEKGVKAYLLDSAPAIGGSMHLLDRTFPTNYCGICIMDPVQPSYCPTLECERHENIKLLPYAEVVKLEGNIGAFTATVRHKPRYVDVDKCNNCGLCAEVCPVSRPADYEGHLAPVKAIYRPPTRAVPVAYVIDMDYCTRCGKCVEVCPTGAIDLDMPEREEQIQVGAVLVAPGFAPFDARRKGEFGYGHCDNVLTSLEFERMVSLAGSTVAHIRRPSDGKPPKRIAFIHCVGSRDMANAMPYCSSVCCMYTAKQVTVAKELDPDLEITVFHMDLRTMGKGYERYFERVKALPGVTYRRAMPARVYQSQRTRNLYLTYVAEDGSLKEEEFDMVVLAVGFTPPPEAKALGKALGIELDSFGFAVTDPFFPGRTTRPGVFVAGAFREPKDIPETVVEAAGIAGEVARVLGSRGAKEQGSKGAEEMPPERDVSDEEPRVGVFVCTCRGEIPRVVDVGAVVEHAGKLDGVALAQVVEDACGADLAAIREVIEQQELNRVVIAGCSQRLYQSKFAALMRQAGLNPQLLERADLREGVAWVHRDVPEQATAKAQAAVEMAVTKSTFHYPISSVQSPISKRGLVIGGGLAGLTAALELAEMGFGVDLVEKSEVLGGNLRTAYYTLEGGKPQELLSSLIKQVEANELISVYLNTEVRELRGTKGNFLTTLTLPDGDDKVLEHGAVIVATGAQPATTTEYLYGQHDKVLTQKELEARLAEIQNPHSAFRVPQSVVMIQCVGSRDENRPYCSRVCCSHAIKNALKLKELNPETRVYVLYREVRTYGFHELYYREARDKGVVFILSLIHI